MATANQTKTNKNNNDHNLHLGDERNPVLCLFSNLFLKGECLLGDDLDIGPFGPEIQ